MGKHQYTCDQFEEPIDFASDSGQASHLLPAPYIHDSRILDPAAYEQVRGNISPPPSDGPLRLRFRAPESPPRGAKWAIEDHDLNTLTWLDVGGPIWEKAQTGSVQHSGMVSVSVWWERAGARTEAYVNERTRLVVFYKLDGRIKVSSLPADVSTSSHNFFGYFPRKGRARLWFAPKTTGLSKEPEQNHRLSHVRPPGNTSHAAVVENPALDLDLMRRAVEGGLPNRGDSSATTPRSGVACYDSLQLTTEEMKVLISSAEETRLRRGHVATVEEKQTDDSADKRHVGRDDSSRPAYQLGETSGVRRVPPYKSPGSRRRLRANDESQHDHGSSLASLRNEFSSSGNDDR
ncbi:hypothetical protein CPLU01_02929 [Colletotrichum plurivorum]|uniref:Uncharacterized protein n=1 Tax=Colletotrichum plurivorum TaxID=2175906 RepID=A0A8H6KUL3_9PEZI|nr:hypothetical protein CPLU01_02929 [Colletotrichum plurivorum]